MSDSNDGPLVALCKKLGIDADFAPIKAVKRIEERPVEVHTVPELFFSTNKRHRYEFAQVPVGTDLGWCCWDSRTYDGDPADGNCAIGYGLTQDEAYAALIEMLDDEPDEPKPTASRVIHSSPFEPNEYADEPRRDVDLDNQE